MPRAVIISENAEMLDSVIEASGDYQYIATAKPGTARSAAAWRVKRIYDDGTTTIVRWAETTGGIPAENCVATDLAALQGLTYAEEPEPEE